MRPGLALLLLLPALAGCTTTSDPDGDNLSDEAERAGWEIRIQAQDGQQVRQVHSDPRVADTDGDGLLDGEEAEARTDPRDVDTDGDGLVDGRDILAHPGDAMFDLLEKRGIVRAADGRFLGEADAGTKPFEWDGDRPIPDGLGDGDELRGWDVTIANRTYAVQSDPTTPDTDGDGLNDLLEKERGCDPTLPDADLDGARDPVDADCAANLKVRVEVSLLHLEESLDPAGDTDLLLTVQTGGLTQTHTQGLKVGDNAIAFSWLADVPDAGEPGKLVVPVALTFVDQDFFGDDDRSGVDKQPICINGGTGSCHVLILDLDMAQRRFTSAQGPSGATSGEARGRDGFVRFSVEPVRG